MGNVLFFFNSTALGTGLAMDAFSVSLVNGMNECEMSRWKAVRIAGVYGFFQALMPMLGWGCAHTVVHCFDRVQTWIPWISLLLLVLIGGNMIRESRTDGESTKSTQQVTPRILILQGVATSIDALSVGFTIADYGFAMALSCSLLIAGVTLLLCVTGVELGKKVGDRLAEGAGCCGGILLILIGIEIWITGIR